MTLRYDVYKNIVHLGLHPRKPPRTPRIEFFEDLHGGEFLKFGFPEWTEETTIEIDDSDFSPMPTRHLEVIQDEEDGTVHVITLKSTNGLSY